MNNKQIIKNNIHAAGKIIFCKEVKTEKHICINCTLEACSFIAFKSIGITPSLAINKIILFSLAAIVLSALQDGSITFSLEACSFIVFKSIGIPPS